MKKRLAKKILVKFLKRKHSYEPTPVPYQILDKARKKLKAEIYRVDRGINGKSTPPQWDVFATKKNTSIYLYADRITKIYYMYD